VCFVFQWYWPLRSIDVTEASLHPNYNTEKDIMDQMEADGQLDDESREMLEGINRARQSPYPTLIVEVKGLLKLDVIGQEHIPADQDNMISTLDSDVDDDVKKQESIFAMSGAMHKRAGNINGGSIYNDDFDQVSSQLRLFEYFNVSLLC
jgi:hypothetical protein